MTMQQMNEYLEKRGFEVERAYIKDLGVYRFVIKKNGNLLGASFKYPVTNDWHYKNEHMQEFLEKIVRDFETRFCVTDMDVASWYPDPEKFWTKENPHVYISTARGCGISKPYIDRMEIKDVIFNDPATIVFWADGTKTVVKCQEGDVFDPEKGLAMAIAKKVYGNKHDYYDPFKKWCGRYYKKRAKIQPWIDAINDAVEKLKDCDS